MPMFNFKRIMLRLKTKSQQVIGGPYKDKGLKSSYDIVIRVIIHVFLCVKIKNTYISRLRLYQLPRILCRH